MGWPLEAVTVPETCEGSSLTAVTVHRRSNCERRCTGVNKHVPTASGEAARIFPKGFGYVSRTGF
jgi:hypothetical protein